ncbi:Hsp20 family protein [Nocardioides jishulii]|uniref:Hsp20/alpha crystallin family protein n=1 Tax=Nocardioides jishulii TaxID=2575440 RepID=A0A4U2YIB6_9ACTN|nr:Hsp20 family protein [Nocardioides jishulii]QCX28143.1 Hsp20/alpha crystallin family protein [Nocardioides jishulii]TKI60808.1 Hsp20/alpha crystallin family protein [Nocardioides jishulii]
MTPVVRRRTSPLADLRSWLESDFSAGFPGPVNLPLVRIEDFVDEGTYVLRAELPGIDPDKDVEITVDDGVLTIQGERSEESKDRDHSEFRYGSFSRSVTLPKDSRVDEITAEYRGGVLELRVPMDQTTSEPKKIQVTRPEG